MKKAFLFISVLFFTNAILAEDIFKQHGFDKETLTLSKGRYEEVFTNDEVVQIGSVLLNTKTNKIIQSLDEETETASFKAEHSSRWLTPDPLAEKYYSISPYVFCNNNPIRYIDPDGRDWYEAENGNAVWRKSKDAEYKDADGNVWKNIGTEYLSSSKNGATLFQQQTNENGEMYLTSTNEKGSILNYLENVSDVKRIEKLVYNEDMPTSFVAMDKVFVVPYSDNNYTKLTNKGLRREFEDEYTTQNNIRGKYWSPVSDMRAFEGLMGGYASAINPLPPIPVTFFQDISKAFDKATVRHYERLMKYYKQYNIIK